MKEWYKDFIGVYENALSKDISNEVINLINNINLKGRGRNEGNSLRKKNRGSNLEFHNMDLFNQIRNFLYKNILPLYNIEYPVFDSIGTFNIPHLKMQKTLPTEGYHIWHFENSDWRVRQRFGVFLIYLNDVNEGGETEFLFKEEGNRGNRYSSLFHRELFV